MSTSAVKRNRKASGAKQNVAPSLVHWRFVVVLAVVISVFVALAARAAFIQVIEPDELIQQGDSRTLRTRNMPTYRGIVTDRNGVELAVSVPVRAIYADPKVIHENDGFNEPRRWQALADVLGQSVDKLQDKVANPKRRFVYLQRQVSPAMADYVDKLDIPGIYLRRESRRYYPTGEVSAQLIGITDVDDTQLDSAKVTISSGFTAGDTLILVIPGTLSSSFISDSILSISGNASIADYEVALHSISYKSSSEDPTLYSSNRTITWVATDANSDGAGAATSEGVASIINITPINDAPTAVNLIRPQDDNIVININNIDTTSLIFEWSSAIDSEQDLLKYIFYAEWENEIEMTFRQVSYIYEQDY